MLQNEISALPTNLNPCPDSNNNPPTHDSQEDTALFSFMKAKLEKKVKTSKSDSIITLRQYLERPHTTPDISPLDYWKNHASEMENLKECALRYLCIPACSTESERVFSRAGCIVSDRRAALKPKTVNKLLFT
ncbi:hypothetical protein ACLKA6_002335, partial [Drosophila palustris]